MVKVKQIRNSCQGQHYPIGPNNPPHYQPDDDRDGQIFCDQYIGGFSGQLRSPEWPSNYKPNSVCVFTLRRASLDVCRVDLYLKNFDLSSPFEASNGQCSDHLELPDRRKLCGRRSEVMSLFYSKSSNFMVFMFRSGEQGRGPGFEIDVQQIAGSCGVRSQQTKKCDKHVKSRNANSRC